MCRKLWLLILPFYNKNGVGDIHLNTIFVPGAGIWTNQSSKVQLGNGGGGVERVKVSVYHYKLSCEVVLGAREILLSPLYPVKESLSLKLQFTSWDHFLFEIISHPGHFIPIHYQNMYIYQFEDELLISREKNDVVS